MLKRRKTLTGFTLIEILTVVTIIALLIAVISITFTDARKKIRDNRSKSDLRQILNALELKYNDLGHYPNLPSTPTRIEDTSNYTDKLDPYLKPPPIGNNVRDYYWYNGGDLQKFCLYFQLEIDPNKYFSCGHKGCQIANTPTCLGF